MSYCQEYNSLPSGQGFIIIVRMCLIHSDVDINDGQCLFDSN